MSVKYYQKLLEVLQQGEVALATVVKSQGSVPREIGAKMIITSDGGIIDTIGGGAGEAKVIQQAKTVLSTGEKQWVNIDLSGAPTRATEGVCGGLMRVWVEKWSGGEAIALTKEIIKRLELGQLVHLFTPFALGEFPYLLEDGQIEPEEERGFSEIINPPPLLLIVGAGHVGVQLAKVAFLVGFRVCIQDDRPEWANRDRYHTAEQIFTANITTTIEQIGHHPQLYIALVTRGFQHDLDAIQAILKHGMTYQYLGMIGSQKRVKMVLQHLRQEQLFTNETNSIYAPIGLDIGALTPEEIAVSIVSELIMVRRGGTGKSLSYNQI